MNILVQKGQTSLIVSPGQKWAQFEKKYLLSDGSSGAKIFMADVEGGDLFARKRIFNFLIFDQVFNC